LLCRLAFTKTPNLQDITIDTRSILKWCPNFMLNEESDALFKHLMQGMKQNRSMKNDIDIHF